ncbi:Dam family site-specific DNA-(adenine-N6)-methyltransferase [Enterobacter vonholyi]
MKPLFKWQGGKTKMIKSYEEIMKKQTHETYVEPFFGAGAIFCHFKNNASFSNYIINDKNKYIMELLNIIKSGNKLFISSLIELEKEYISLKTKELRKEFYYNIRERYYLYEDNKHLSISDGFSCVCSALLYFLMKTSFNGLWQPMKSRSYYFGTAFGLGNEKSLFDYNLIEEWRVNLQDTQIECLSYKHLYVPDDSFVFCDPPYIDQTVSYGEPAIDTVHLLKWCEIKSRNNCSVFMSNRFLKDSYYENFTNYDDKYVFDVSYSGGKKSEYNKKEVLLKWNNKEIKMIAA